MKRFLTMAFCVLAVTLGAGAQNLQKGSYGYLYCHMSDKGEWTAYALSRDGYHYEDVLGGDPVFDPAEHARIEGGTHMVNGGHLGRHRHTRFPLHGL